MKKSTNAKGPPRLRIVYRPTASLVPYATNPRTHSDGQIELLAGSMRRFGWTIPVLVDGERGIIAGHGRVLAAAKLGLKELPCIERADMTDAERRAYLIADNRLAELAGWDRQLLGAELKALQDLQLPLAELGFSPPDLDELLNAGAAAEGAAGPTLAERFMVPPFTVLNAREGWWQDRKRAWLALGIKSEIGRAENLLNFSDSARASGRKRRAASAFDTEGNIAGEWGGTSIFDPVLCEVAYRWFCPPGGLVVDPFAGGSVRGVVAHNLGLRYHGCDLSKDQVEANREQARLMCGTGQARPTWTVGDARELEPGSAPADFVFSCPPYADLERYSDNPADLSAMNYPDFLTAYRDIVAKWTAALKPNRFACFVVGEVRATEKDGRGLYRNLIGETVRAFRDAGLGFYNEAILVTAVGSLPMRVVGHFKATRKLGKTHQNVLVFIKGDARKAVEACGEVDVALPDALAGLGETHTAAEAAAEA